MKGKILIIAGSDSGGGAGIQADIKTVTMLGSYAATAITALTAQNTLGVFGIYEIPEDFIIKQIDVVLSDIGADIIKTGMLHNSKIINAISHYLINNYPDINLVVDPVMISKSGHKLLEEDAVNLLKTTLIARALLVTPNIPEAEILSGQEITSIESMILAGKKIKELGAKSVLVKGGHKIADEITNVLITDKEVYFYKYTYINTLHTHGTGCTLASAISAFIAQGQDINKAVENAGKYVHNAIRTAPGFGKGHGPLNHRNEKYFNYPSSN